jgi:uncharacterized phage protein (TIGR01671 family)
MEILFRGKRTDNGEWVYGFYGHKPNGNEVEEHFIMEWDFSRYVSNPAYTYFQDIPIIPETVGQYTGYDDKNGRQIFGGDIVESGTCVAVVVFEKGAFVLKSNGGYTHKALMLNQAVWKVIGNIHDNQEMLECK